MKSAFKTYVAAQFRLLIDLFISTNRALSSRDLQALFLARLSNNLFGPATCKLQTSHCLEAHLLYIMENADINIVMAQQNGGCVFPRSRAGFGQVLDSLENSSGSASEHGVCKIAAVLWHIRNEIARSRQA